jgi:hypothetical protein
MKRYLLPSEERNLLPPSRENVYLGNDLVSEPDEVKIGS